MCSLRWRHNDHAGVSNHQPHGCLLNRLFRRTSKKTLKLRVTGLCAGNSPGTGEFPAQMASYAENVSIWWRHHVLRRRYNLVMCNPLPVTSDRCICEGTIIYLPFSITHWGLVMRKSTSKLCHFLCRQWLVPSETPKNTEILSNGRLGVNLSEI